MCSFYCLRLATAGPSNWPGCSFGSGVRWATSIARRALPRGRATWRERHCHTLLNGEFLELLRAAPCVVGDIVSLAVSASGALWQALIPIRAPAFRARPIFEICLSLGLHLVAADIEMRHTPRVRITGGSLRRWRRWRRWPCSRRGVAWKGGRPALTIVND